SFYWLVRVQSELQGGTQQFQEQTFERMTSNVAWQDASFNRSNKGGHILTVALLNTGTTKVPITNSSQNPKVQWSLLDSEQDLICAEDWSGGTKVSCVSGCGTDLAVKELRLVKINLSTSTDCNITTKANDTLLFAKISFSGKTTTAGTFRK
ncbi:MAG: hypothetical protein QF535_06810, partial [Anaerolineales bacterium]|nr:hypothetical protein [Anaerolineales bacterium]